MPDKTVPGKQTPTGGVWLHNKKKWEEMVRLKQFVEKMMRSCCCAGTASK